MLDDLQLMATTVLCTAGILHEVLEQLKMVRAAALVIPTSVIYLFNKNARWSLCARPQFSINLESCVSVSSAAPPMDTIVR